MKTHPYLRAYLAGAFVPTLVLPLLLFASFMVRLAFQGPLPLERGLVFPMALVPMLWALWNMLWIGSHPRTHLPIGLHGALLPLILMPCGAVLATCLGILAIGSSGVVWFQSLHLSYALIGPMFLAALVAYYLVWKYVVGFLNRILGIA
jgi:hypothetical protein